MTINIAVVTGEAFVLGCDSIASTTRRLLDPFKLTKKDLGSGKFSIDFSYDDLGSYVTSAWGGVTKMFPLQN